ncbi:MAG: TonB family protein [Acidobacteriota bacterium]
MRKFLFLLGVLVCLAAGVFAQTPTEGSLYAAGKNGKELGACPLKSTAVKTEISGFLARVNVRQEFENNFTEPIEAVYTFPLSQNGAVDNMTMTIGSRVVRGKIKRRDEARQIYDAAKAEGKTTSLLDQERPNIFTQSVANIMPGESVVIEISYVETLKYEDGAYEFVFPMTVGSRYIPGSVKDAAKISPPVTATRNGSDISIEVNLNAGVPVEEIRSTSHAIDQINFAPNAARVTLRGEKTIPNKDFILRYDVTGKRIEDAVLVHRDERGGFFTMILQPPDKIASEDRTPKEIVFVLDTSGSMHGFPIDKAKEAMKLSLEGLYPDDTFNLITFAGDTSVLFERPVPATQSNLERAEAFLDSRQGGGGTEMMKAIQAALEPSDAQDHLRIVCFMTDGYVGNEGEIIAEIQKHPQARVFSFGIGSSVNRFLLDKMAAEGKGEAEYVALTDDGSKAAKKFYERVRTPLLTDLSIDWNGMPVADIYPGKMSDLFSAKPVILHGRYTKPGTGTIKLKGKVAGQDYTREIAVNFPEAEAANDVLSTLWARTRIDALSSDKLKTENASKAADFDTQITNLGLEFRLLTEFTSFVAVEERVVNQNGNPVKVEVPVMIPEGVDPETTVGAQADVVSVTASGGGGGGIAVLPINGRKLEVLSSLSRPPDAKILKKRSSGSGVGYGSGNGSGQGSGSGGGNASTVVNVTSAGSVTTDATDTKMSTNISVKQLEQLPKGTGFISLLRTSAAIRSEPLGGQFSINGATGPENTFMIDGSEVTGEMLRLTGLELEMIRADQRKPSNRAAETPKYYPLNGRAIMIPEPTYPKEAKAAKAKGEVEVEIKIDAAGNVVSATAASGPQELRRAAETAAMLSKFAPTFAEGRAVRVAGVIVYNFVNTGKVEVSVRKMTAESLNAEEKKALLFAQKLHFWLYDLYVRVRDGKTDAGENDAKFVRDGLASVEIALVPDSTLDALRKAGFDGEFVKGSRTKAVGRIAPDRLGALAELKEVRLIIPKY